MTVDAAGHMVIGDTSTAGIRVLAIPWRHGVN
jgi:hypothetical protein